MFEKEGHLQFEAHEGALGSLQIRALHSILTRVQSRSFFLISYLFYGKHAEQERKIKTFCMT